MLIRILYGPVSEVPRYQWLVLTDTVLSLVGGD